MDDPRKKLLDAKTEIEARAKIRFSKEYLALADLISEFVVVKMEQRLGQLVPQSKETDRTTIGQATGEPVTDDLYGPY